MFNSHFFYKNKLKMSSHSPTCFLFFAFVFDIGTFLLSHLS